MHSVSTVSDMKELDSWDAYYIKTHLQTRIVPLSGPRWDFLYTLSAKVHHNRHA